ncbi:MAG: DMT family transporter [Pseudomonadota bacterium]
MTARAAALPDLMLLAVAAIWGSSYGVAKSALVVYPVLGLVALRFGITFALLLPALRHLRQADRRTWLRLLGTGALLLGIFLCETFGLLLTQATNAALLISLCVVFTSGVEWLLLGRRPSRIEWIAVVLSLAGALLLSGAQGFELNGGDMLILAAALLRAFNVCVTKRAMNATRDLPALSVTAVQSGVVASGSVIAMLAFAPSQWQPLPSLSSQPQFWACVLYLVLACTLFAFFAQNHAIGRRSPTRVALLMGSEPIFGAMFAMVWLGESMSLAGWFGGSLIVTSAWMASMPLRRGAPPVSRPERSDVVRACPGTH